MPNQALNPNIVQRYTVTKPVSSAASVSATLDDDQDLAVTGSDDVKHKTINLDIGALDLISHYSN